MAESPDNNRRSGVSRRRFLQGAAGGAAYLAGGSLIGRVAEAQGQSAGSNVIVEENRNAGPGTDAFRLANYDGSICGFAASTSVNRNQPVPLKLICYREDSSFNPIPTSARLEVYRLGYYGGDGGRRVYQSPVFTLPTFPEQGDAVRNPQFGLSECATWDASPETTIPATATQVSGMYLVKIVATSGPPGQNHIPFIVRDDARARDLLVAMPTNSWQAYNNWDGKSLYTYNSSGSPVTDMGSSGGRSRAAKVSFDRPYLNVLADYNWVLRTEFPLLYWLERQGYDVAYTDDFGLHSQPGQLMPDTTKTLVIAGHNEYWTKQEFDNVEAARNAGTNIASFSANTAYWQVRYENSANAQLGRTLACFKTVQGTDANGADQGADGVNDYGPGAAVRGGASDPLGPNGQRDVGGDDRPQFATTTFRDRGVAEGGTGSPNGNPVREGRGRVGPNRSENALFGVLYVGDDDSISYPLEVPAGEGAGGEFGAHPAWRHTTVANRQGATIGETPRLGTNLVGWEWDAIPAGTGGQPYALFKQVQPGGVKRLSETDPTSSPPPGNEIAYLQDDGRVYTSSPPPGQGPNIHAVTYRHATSGALVFASGTMQWSWGLGPHYLDTFADNYMDPSIDTSQPVIQQATYNILADTGVKPATPVGITLDAEPSPETPATPIVTGKPPPPLPKKHKPRVALRRQPDARLRADGVVLRRLTCPRSELKGVYGTITLVGLVPRRSRTGRPLKPRRVKLGSKRFKLRPRQSARVAVKLSRSNQRLVRGRKRMKVVAELSVSDYDANKAKYKPTFILTALRAARPGSPRA